MMSTILMAGVSVVVYWAASDVRMGLALVGALVIGVSWHLEQRLEGLKNQIDRLRDRISH
jgi:hypothetical protein